MYVEYKVNMDTLYNEIYIYVVWCDFVPRAQF